MKSERVCKSLKTNSPGPDGIHPRIVKDLMQELLVSLKIFSSSLEEGVVLEDFNIAQITPIFKDSKNDPGKYRPASLTRVQ